MWSSKRTVVALQKHARIMPFPLAIHSSKIATTLEGCRWTHSTHSHKTSVLYRPPPPPIPLSSPSCLFQQLTGIEQDSHGKTTTETENLCPTGRYCIAEVGNPTLCPVGTYNPSEGITAEEASAGRCALPMILTELRCMVLVLQVIDFTVSYDDLPLKEEVKTLRT